MNRGVLQSSPVQQIMAAGNPNWWPIPAVRPPSTHHLPSSAPFSPPLPIHHNNFNFLPPQTHHSPFPFSSPSWPLNNNNISNNDNFNDNSTQQDQTTPYPWSQQQQQQLFMNGLVAEEERVAAAAAAGLISLFPEPLHHQHQHQHQHQMEQLVKQESSKSCGFVYGNNEFMGAANSTNSSNTVTATTSSPQSCITTFSGNNNLMEFSSAAATAAVSDPPLPQAPATADRSSECNSSAVNGGAVKKAKVQSSANQSTFKVRKFGDRITALHQLVSPFGKTDTASVLLEAIGYIRFLQSQIEALSIPYLSNGSGNNKRQQHPQSAQGERNCIFPEDPGQLLNDKCLKRKGGPNQEEPKEDLRSRGLCLVPVSCTMDVGRENGADYWAPSLGGFR